MDKRHCLIKTALLYDAKDPTCVALIMVIPSPLMSLDISQKASHVAAFSSIFSNTTPQFQQLSAFPLAYGCHIRYCTSLKKGKHFRLQTSNASLSTDIQTIYEDVLISTQLFQLPIIQHQCCQFRNEYILFMRQVFQIDL